jgi:translation initiation factor IF-2
LAQEKIRIYQLASLLNMHTKDLLELCQRHGIDVRNQLSTLDPDQRDRVVELVKRGASAPPSAPSKPAAASKLPTEPKKIATLESSRRAPAPSKTAEPTAPAAPAVPAAAIEATPPEPEPEPVAPAPEVNTAPEPVAESRPPVEPPAHAPAAETQLPPSTPPPIPAPAVPVTQPAATAPPVEPVKAPEKPAASRPQTPPAAPAEPPRPVTPRADRPMRNLAHPARPSPAKPPERKPPQPTTSGPRQGGPRVAPPPPQKQKPATAEEKKPPPAPPQTGPRKLADIPADLDTNRPISLAELLRPPSKPAGGTPATPDAEVEEDEEGKKGAKKPHRSGGVAGRDQRHSQRQARAKDRLARGDGKGLLLEDDRPQTRHLTRTKRPKPITEKRKGKVPIELPITVRSLSEAVGLQSGKLLMQLVAHGAPARITINSTLDPELAEALALENGCELDVKRPPDAEEILLKESESPDAPENLVLRAPIVTIMGHVDHGKTSLLDRIRESNVVDTEAGGITQVLRAWRVEHNGRPITFLDTPGHEAFTKMRARGANVTDIAVIVVAATDGVMPQTEEAISHAKAAEVAIIVAINKIDMPNANIPKTERQLYNLGLIPDTMGGEVQFVQTSAITGKGVPELLDTISLVAEVHELKANPNRPAQGTCLEASVNEGEGVMATLLVQDGTLHRGDVLLCGAAHGRVRAMYNDIGKPIDEAGPSVPCRVTGLDIIPNADDPFLVVEDLAVAREISEKRQNKAQEASLKGREQMTIEEVMQSQQGKVTELKIVLKADVKGSVEAIKKELEKLHHEEVRVRVLHTGIGAINESDVTLGMISPSDTMIVGFNVVPDDAAKALADSRGIKIREYKIIYELTGDIRAALEGKLKPREEIVHLGRAVVRETFKISRVGTIAGCRVTQGAIERSAKVRVIRNGVVVYPPGERTVGLDSLKRFKEDAREVQQGYECGLKITGYDDIKVDDVIECYRIDQVQRTLSSQ